MRGGKRAEDVRRGRKSTYHIKLLSSSRTSPVDLGDDAIMFGFDRFRRHRIPLGWVECRPRR